MRQQWLGLLLAGAGLFGCAGEGRVVRVYDGRIIEGRYVAPEAYAAFLRGMLAEEAGDPRSAVVAYQQAASEEPSDPEPWTRIAEMRCKADPKDPEADRALARALKIDPRYAGALAAGARCALARGNGVEAVELARRASLEDPTNVNLSALTVRAGAADPSMRQRAIELTLAHRESAAAWDALIVWGRARRDAELIARGLEGLVRAAPTRSGEVEKGAVALLVGGQLGLARRVAVAVTDAPRELGVVGPREALVARLAVDEALARGDRATAIARATRGHVALEEVAARAMLLDHRDLAADLAAQVAAADPASSGAQMVKAALQSVRPGAKPASSRVEPLTRVLDLPPELCALVFAEQLAVAAGPEVARAWLARISRTPMPPRDPLAVPLAADLTARGILPPLDLPAEKAAP